MRNAVAIWNYCWNTDEISDWIREFAGYGFDAISFHPNQFAGKMPHDLQPLMDTVGQLDLGVTLHGSVTMEPELMEMTVGLMGDRLLAFTLDSAMQEDSRGRFHDAGRIAMALSRLQELTKDREVWLAVEDFPLDELALGHFQAELETVYSHPRTGILVDIGHMHLRRSASAYFSRRSVKEYFERLPCRIVEVHLHDNDGTTDQHGPFGLGRVPFAEVAAALKEVDFCGVSTMEIAPGFHGCTPQESKCKAVESLRLWRRLMESESDATSKLRDGDT